jgi:DNA polymerase III subunit epsilon
MILFFDTETTGRPLNYKAPVTDSKNWPRMVQLAWVQTDNEGNILQEGNHIIKPVGYTIPNDVVKIHGISTEIALEKGEDLATVLTQFEAIIQANKFIIAHNIVFDDSIIRAEYHRLSMPTALPQKKQFCTMKSKNIINYCALSGSYGFKWPSLSELHKKLFKEDFGDAHNALNDVKATAKCYWKLKELGVI